jgi:DNA repair and recombination protein RAD54 and RAD54-like protein
MQFFAMVNFCNPGVLGSPSAFQKYYANPILASREPGASPEVLKKGEERSEELSGIVNDFILRRTNKLLSEFQPPKVSDP